MTRTRATLLLALLALCGLQPVQSQTRPAEEQPLQDEKIFQQLLADYHLLARLLIHQNRISEGVPILKSVYDLSFRPPTLAIELCDIMDRGGMPSETIPILREQMLREPLNEDWATRLIDACERSKKWKEVLDLRLERRKKHPTDLENLGGLAEAYRQLQRNKEADALIDKISITARDKLFLFEKPLSLARDPNQGKIDAEGFIALKLQRELELQDDFEQYAAAFVLRQGKPEIFDPVMEWLQSNPPKAYAKSVFPDQKVIGLWLAGKKAEAAAILEKKYPARQYPGADRLLARYYTLTRHPEKLQERFGKEMPEYLKGMTPPAASPRETTSAATPREITSPSLPAPAPVQVPVTNSVSPHETNSVTAPGAASPRETTPAPDSTKDNPDGDVGEAEAPDSTSTPEAPQSPQAP